MFELLITVLFVPLFLVFEETWLKLLLSVSYLAIVIPGLYAHCFGAPFLPTKGRQIEVMLRLANITKGEKVVDLGCGDGRLLLAFEKVSPGNVVGYEFSIPTFLLAKFLTVGRDVEVIYGNFWSLDLSEMDVILCFLQENSMARFERELWPKLKSGTKVLSNHFKMGKAKSVRNQEGIHLYVKK